MAPGDTPDVTFALVGGAGSSRWSGVTAVKYFAKLLRDWYYDLPALFEPAGEPPPVIERWPDTFVLDQNYPNPFNPFTTIRNEIPVASDVRLTVYDLLGREVKTLVSERQEPRAYNATFDASTVASGVYVYRLETGRFTASRKMIVVR